MIDNVAHSAHAGGLIIGALVGFLLPLWQQPRLVTTNPGAVSGTAEFASREGEWFVSKFTVDMGADFDPSRNCLAVEYDRVDFLGRRYHWYESIFGTMCENVREVDLIHIASARQVGSESAFDHMVRVKKEAGTPYVEKKKQSGSRLNYTYLIIVFTYLMLSNLQFSHNQLVLMMVLGAVGTIASWYYLLHESFRKSKISALAIATVLIGAATAGAFYLGEIELVARLLLAVAAGTIIPRMIFAREKKEESES